MQRVRLLVRLEGLLLGGAAELEVFGERLRELREALAPQLLDRWVPVSADGDRHAWTTSFA